MPRIIKSKTKESETAVDNHDEEVIVKKAETKTKIIEVSDNESEEEEKPKVKSKAMKKGKTTISTKEEKVEKAEDSDEEDVVPEPIKVEKKTNTKSVKKTNVNIEENWINMKDEEAPEAHNASEVSDNEEKIKEIKSEISNKFDNSQFKKTFKPSIADFDNEEIWKLDQDKLKEIDTNTLLKVLMVRGMKNNNPTLFGKAKGLLKDLNFEPPYFKSNNHFNKDSYNNRNYSVNDSIKDYSNKEFSNDNNIDNNTTRHFTKNSYNRNYRNNETNNNSTIDLNNNTSNTFEPKENTEFKPSNNFNSGFRGGRGGFNRGGFRGGFRSGFRDNNRGGFSSGFTKKTEE